MRWDPMMRWPAKKTLWVWLFSLAVLPLLGATARGADPVSPVRIKEAPDSFMVAGRRITVEQFAPAEEGKYPVILLLHGVEGMSEGGQLYKLQARQYAKKGYVVLLLHYYDRTDLHSRDLTALQNRFRHYFSPKDQVSAKELQDMEKHFADWVDTSKEAVRHAAKLPNALPSRIGVVGVSLGGALALLASSPKDLEIAAVVELFGGLAKHKRVGLKAMPPTLMIHGTEDDLIPNQEAEDLRDWLKKMSPVEYRSFKGMGHVFKGGKSEDIRDAMQTMEVFLKKHLQEKPSAKLGN